MSVVKIWVHFVWSTKERQPFLMNPDVRRSLFEHVVENAKQKDLHLECFNGWIDHVHALVSLGPNQTIAKVAQLLKGESSRWMNESGQLHSRFEWQNDYYAVSISEAAVGGVREYIRTQDEHHRMKSFGEEMEKIQDFRPRPSGQGGRG